MTTQIESPYMKLNEACDYLKCCRRTALEMIYSGQLKAFKRGRNWLITKEAADKTLRAFTASR